MTDSIKVANDMTKEFITMECKETINLLGDSNKEVKLNVDVDTIQSGVISELGVYNFSVLMCIASHMNNQGISLPSQRRISELTGISINKVTKCVNELLDTEINGEKIFTRTFAKGIKGKKTVYQFSSEQVTTEEIKQLPQEQPEVESIVEPKAKMNAKDVVVHYVEAYEKAFGDGYIVSWGKEMKLVKDKLLPNFESEDIKKLIDIAVGQYSNNWGNPKYPRPSISMVCGWLGKEAWKIVLADKQKEQAFETRVQQGQEAQPEMDRFLNL